LTGNAYGILVTSTAQAIADIEARLARVPGLRP